MDDIIVNVHTTNKSRNFVKLFFNVKHHLLLRSRGAECPLMVPLKGLKDRKSRRLPTVCAVCTSSCWKKEKSTARIVVKHEEKYNS